MTRYNKCSIMNVVPGSDGWAHFPCPCRRVEGTILREWQVGSLLSELRTKFEIISY